MIFSERAIATFATIAMMQVLRRTPQRGHDETGGKAMDTIEIEQAQAKVDEAAATVGLLDLDASDALLSLGDMMHELREVVANAVEAQRKFASTGGVKDCDTAERSLRQLVWRMRMLANAARTARETADGIIEDYR